MCSGLLLIVYYSWRRLCIKVFVVICTEDIRSMAEKSDNRRLPTPLFMNVNDKQPGELDGRNGSPHAHHHVLRHAIGPPKNTNASDCCHAVLDQNIGKVPPHSELEGSTSSCTNQYRGHGTNDDRYQSYFLDVNKNPIHSRGNRVERVNQLPSPPLYSDDQNGRLQTYADDSPEIRNNPPSAIRNRRRPAPYNVPIHKHADQGKSRNRNSSSRVPPLPQPHGRNAATKDVSQEQQNALHNDVHENDQFVEEFLEEIVDEIVDEIDQYEAEADRVALLNLANLPFQSQNHFTLETAAETLFDEEWFFASRDVRGFHDLYGHVDMNEDCCKYSLQFFVFDPFGGTQHSLSGWIEFPRRIRCDTFHHWIEDGFFIVQAQFVD